MIDADAALQPRLQVAHISDCAYVDDMRTGLRPFVLLAVVGVAGVFLLIAIIGEFVAGLRFEGVQAMPVLLGELARTIVLAVVLWGVGDLVRLMITVGNDIRAERILLARLVFRTPAQRAEDEASDGDPVAETPREVLDPHYRPSDDAAAD